jgi:hypothetical protein
MTITAHHHQLDDLRQEWRQIARSAPSQASAALLVARLPALSSRAPRHLGDVVELLEPRSGLSQLERAQVVTTMLELAPRDPLLRRALLQTLLPGVVAVARRLDWGHGHPQVDDAASFLADLITTMYEVIVEWGGQRRSYAAPDLLNAVRCRMRRRLESDALSAAIPLEVADLRGQIPSSLDDDPTESLASLLRAQRAELDPIGAAALYGREVLGLSYRELASMTGLSPRRLAEASRTVARRIFE